MVATGFVVVSCGSAEKDLKIVESTQWKLTSLAGVDNMLMPEVDSYTLNFSVADGRYFGKGNCNRYFGTYLVEKDFKVKFSVPGATMMMCPDDKNIESVYFGIFNKVSSFIINDGNLELTDEKGSIIATYKAKKAITIPNEESTHGHSGDCNH